MNIKLGIHYAECLFKDYQFNWIINNNINALTWGATNFSYTLLEGLNNNNMFYKVIVCFVWKICKVSDDGCCQINE